MTPTGAAILARTAPIGAADPRVTVRSLGRDDAFRSGTDGIDVEGPTWSVHLGGGQAVLGPLRGPGTLRPACDLCLARRWQAVRPQALRDALELGTGTWPVTAEPWSNPFAADTVAAILDFVENPSARDELTTGTRYSTVIALDLERLIVQRTRIVADPGCPRCGVPVPDAPELAVLVIGSVPKRTPSDFRRQDIKDYPIEIEAFVNPLCGSLGPAMVLDVLSPTTAATVGCFTTRSGSYLRETFWGGHADNYDDSARIGVLEGLERAAGRRPWTKRTRVVAAFDDLTGPAVDPRTCGLYQAGFYQQNPWVREFAPDRPISWVWGWSLRDQHTVLVPEVLTYYHIPDLGNRFVQESSNGSASGGCVEETVYFGLMELIERDAFLLAWYGGQPLPELDPMTSTRPRTRTMVQRLAMYGSRARFFDARVTFDIPVVVAVAERLDGGLGTLCFGAGASLDPEEAMAAALCEIATDSPQAQLRTRDHEPRLREMVRDFSRVLQLHDHPLLYGIPEMRCHAGFLLDDGPDMVSLAERFEVARPIPERTSNLRDDIALSCNALTAEGFDVVVIDHTLPEQRELGLASHDVVVPGLLPIDFGWSRQRAWEMSRLRTAGREAGLRPADLTRAQLNPAPHPFP